MTQLLRRRETCSSVVYKEKGLAFRLDKVHVYWNYRLPQKYCLLSTRPAPREPSPPAAPVPTTPSKVHEYWNYRPPQKYSLLSTPPAPREPSPPAAPVPTTPPAAETTPPAARPFQLLRVLPRPLPDGPAGGVYSAARGAGGTEKPGGDGSASSGRRGLHPVQ